MTKISQETSTAVESATVPLSILSIDSANVRKTGRGKEPKFAASIRKRGVIEPMLVRRQDGRFAIVNGGERFTALQYLKKKGEKANGVAVTDDFPVRVEITDRDDADARATSLATNIIRSSMHPVDEFEAFASMISDGATVEQIAEEYAMKVAEVRQALSLAAIAEPIRKAWREGKISGEAAEAYAQTKDLAHQVRVFEKLKGRAGESWNINNELLGARQHEIRDMLKFVGQKEYEAAGHHVNVSLFGDDDDRIPTTIDNVPALVAMYTKKLADECDRLTTKEGWGWAVVKDDAPRDVHAWRRLPPKTPTKEQKASAGCIVDVDYQGKLRVERGYVKPGVSVTIPKTAKEKAASKKKGGATANGGAGVISGALADTMSRQITLAAADALAKDGHLALRVVVAAMACDDSPARIDVKGMLSIDDEDARDENEFAKYLALTKKKTVPALLELLATWAARSIDLGAHRADQLPLTGEGREACAALLNEIAPKALNAALRDRFDAKDYFSRISKALIVRAIEEAIPTLSIDKSKKTAELAAIAIVNVPRTGWLPPEFRAAGYDGPKAIPKKPVGAGKKPTKKKAVARKKRQ